MKLTAETKRNLNKNVSECFMRLRQSLGLSQLEMANLCGISQPVLCRIENGENLPSTPTLILMSDYFKVSINDIINNNPVSYFDNEKDNAFLVRFKFMQELSKEDQELILNTAYRLMK